MTLHCCVYEGQCQHSNECSKKLWGIHLPVFFSLSKVELGFKL